MQIIVNEHFASVGQIQDNQFDTISVVETELNENNSLIIDQQNFKFCPVSTGEVMSFLEKYLLGKPLVWMGLTAVL